MTSVILFSSCTLGCGSGQVGTFIRVSRAQLNGNAVYISEGNNDVTCSQICRQNRDSTNGRSFNCASFNFDGGQRCYFFSISNSAGGGSLSSNPGSNYFYYEKVCLSGVSRSQACLSRAFSFERIRGSRLDGFVKAAQQASSRDNCLALCLQQSGFVCRSANFNASSQFCEMSDQDRRSRPQNLRQASDSSVDYFESNCLNRQNRCGSGQAGGNLVFVKTAYFEIHGFDQQQTVESSESACLQRCLDSPQTLCRSVEYSSRTRKCVLSDQDSVARADAQGEPYYYERKDYYEPVCISSDLSSSTCRQQAAFTRQIGLALQGDPIATASEVTAADCLSLCFQNLDCRSANYDRSQRKCWVFSIDRSSSPIKSSSSVDYYEFHCESQFGGMALCTNEGIKFIVSTKRPYSGAIFAAEHYSTCRQVATNARQIQMIFPPPTVSNRCGTTLKNGQLEALVVVSLDGVVPHQVTTEWDRLYRVRCDTSLDGEGEGSVVVTSIYDAEDVAPTELPVGTPGPVTAMLMFVDGNNSMVTSTNIGSELWLVAKSPDTGPTHMMLTDCQVSRVGGTGDTAPFSVIDNGCPTYPSLVGPVVRDLRNSRLAAHVKAFRLDGSFDIRMTCTVMFCAGPSGCPPSNCLDASSYQLFRSFGKRKRRDAATGNSSSEDDGADEGQQLRVEQLAAVIRVLADGERAEDETPERHSRSENLELPGDAEEDAEMLCIAQSSFVAIITSSILLCLLFSAVIVSWGCARLNLHSAPSSGSGYLDSCRS